MTSEKSIAIIGAGLIGMFIGINLSNAATVYFVGRSETWKKKLLSSTLTSSKLNQTLGSCSNPNCWTSFDQLEESHHPDIIIISVKRIALAEVLQQLKASLVKSKPRKVVIVTMMNGIGASEEAKKLLEVPGFEFEFVEGMWSTNVVEKDNNWHQGSSGHCYLQSTPAGEELAGLFNKVGLDTCTSASMASVQYGKLLMNLNNAINALSGIPLKRELTDSGYRHILAKCIWEALDVFEKSGITPISLTKVPTWVTPYFLFYTPSILLGPILNFVVKMDDKATSSMYEDLKANRTTEIDFLQGEICRMANLVEVKVPYCRGVVELIKERETEKDGIKPHTAADILDRIKI